MQIWLAGCGRVRCREPDVGRVLDTPGLGIGHARARLDTLSLGAETLIQIHNPEPKNPTGFHHQARVRSTKGAWMALSKKMCWIRLVKPVHF